MTDDRSIDFKDPFYITTWLEAALEKEKEKNEPCPVTPDMVPDYIAAQGWGYVIVGYFLVEQAFKALLHIRRQQVDKTHSLVALFDRIDQEDKKVLREYYTDFKMTNGGNAGSFPFTSLDDFLVNLDGDKNDRGNHIGSFVWRYFLIEENRRQPMPLVSIEYLHEIVLACIQIIRFATSGGIERSRHTRSSRMHKERKDKYESWFDRRINAEGWAAFGARCEILWGPDYRGFHDICFFEGNKMTLKFSEIPTDLNVQIVDRRKEIMDVLGIV